MKNSIDARIEFSFKGETYSPSATIDLDELFEHYELFPSLHALLAEKHGIDTYSYLYEIMQEEEIVYSNAQGLAAEFLNNGAFDAEAYSARRQEIRVLGQLQAIALRELEIDNLEQHPALKKALFLAYYAGRNA